MGRPDVGREGREAESERVLRALPGRGAWPGRARAPKKRIEYGDLEGEGRLGGGAGGGPTVAPREVAAEPAQVTLSDTGRPGSARLPRPTTRPRSPAESGSYAPGACSGRVSVSLSRSAATGSQSHSLALQRQGLSLTLLLCSGRGGGRGARGRGAGRAGARGRTGVAKAVVLLRIECSLAPSEGPRRMSLRSSSGFRSRPVS